MLWVDVLNLYKHYNQRDALEHWCASKVKRKHKNIVSFLKMFSDLINEFGPPTPTRISNYIFLRYTSFGRVFCLNVLPRQHTIHQHSDNAGYLHFTHTNLRHTISFPKRHCLVFEHSIIHSDSKRNPKFISSSISLSNGCTTWPGTNQILILCCKIESLSMVMQILYCLKQEVYLHLCEVPVSTIFDTLEAVRDAEISFAFWLRSGFWTNEKTVVFVGATRGVNLNMVLAP